MIAFTHGMTCSRTRSGNNAYTFERPWFVAPERTIHHNPIDGIALILHEMCDTIFLFLCHFTRGWSRCVIVDNIQALFEMQLSFSTIILHTIIIIDTIRNIA